MSLLLDVGSTAVKAQLAVADGVLAECSQPMPGALPGRRPGRHEIDPVEVLAAVRRAVEQVLDGGHHPDRIAVSTQMHTALIAEADGTPLTPMISWQDDRLAEVVDGRRRLEALDDAVPAEARLAAGIARRPGFGAGNLAVQLQEQPVRPQPGARIHTVGSFVATALGGPYAVHLSAGASLGLVDLDRGEWSAPLRRGWGLEGFALPELVDGYRPLGTAMVQGRLLEWFPEIGDHQASVLGGGGLEPDELAVSLGTAGIAARWSPERSRSSEVDSRPYPGGGYLLAVSRLPGGRLADQLAGFLAGVARMLAGRSFEVGEVWRTAGALAASPQRAAVAPVTGGLAVREDRGADGVSAVTLHGIGSGPADGVFEALMAHYTAEYRRAIALLWPEGEGPSRLRFNGGLAMRSGWFRERFAAELGLEVADFPTGDLALAGLRRLLQQYDHDTAASSVGEERS